MKKYRFYNKICTEREIFDQLDLQLAEIKRVGSRYHEIYNLIPTNSRVLDYGCGFGLFTGWVAEKSELVDGIDLEKNEIEVATLINGNRENLTFSNSQITDLGSAYYDTVISNQVAEHVHNVGNYLAQINRVLKKNGRLIISIPNVSSPRYFLPPLSKKFKKLSAVKIFSGDKDFAQLVNKNVTLINPMSSDIMDEKAVKKKFGVEPTNIIDYLALVGDKSDNIPGVPGVGSKTASRLINKYGDVESIIHQKDIIPGKVGESIKSFTDS